jgi:hypothetical protein
MSTEAGVLGYLFLNQRHGIRIGITDGLNDECLFSEGYAEGTLLDRTGCESLSEYLRQQKDNGCERRRPEGMPLRVRGEWLHVVWLAAIGNIEGIHYVL